MRAVISHKAGLFLRFTWQYVGGTVIPVTVRGQHTGRRRRRREKNIWFNELSFGQCDFGQGHCVEAERERSDSPCMTAACLCVCLCVFARLVRGPAVDTRVCIPQTVITMFLTSRPALHTNHAANWLHIKCKCWLDCPRHVDIAIKMMALKGQCTFCGSLGHWGSWGYAALNGGVNCSFESSFFVCVWFGTGDGESQQRGKSCRFSLSFFLEKVLFVHLTRCTLSWRSFQA